MAGKRLLVCVLGLAAAFSAAADESKNSSAEAADAAKVKEDKVVCKKIKVTGTHFRKRICQKRSVWKEIEEESQRAMDELSVTRGGGTVN